MMAEPTTMGGHCAVPKKENEKSSKNVINVEPPLLFRVFPSSTDQQQISSPPLLTPFFFKLLKRPN